MSPKRPREPGACEAIQDLIPRLVGAESSPPGRGRPGEADRALVEAHAGRCPACRDELAACRELARVLRRHMKGPEPPSGFPGAVRRRLKAR